MVHCLMQLVLLLLAPFSSFLLVFAPSFLLAFALSFLLVFLLPFPLSFLVSLFSFSIASRLQASVFLFAPGPALPIASSIAR